MSADDNATWLFKKPHDHNHNSESFWSSLFALQILEASRIGQGLQIPMFQYREDVDRWWFDQDGLLNIPRDLKFQQIVIEGYIRDNLLGKQTDANKDFYNLKPDISIQLEGEILIIEVKTVGHKIGRRQKSLYERLCQHLVSRGHRASLYFLISAGHEENSDLQLLKSSGTGPSTFKILLWEQFFKSVAEQLPNSLIARCLDNLSAYYIAENKYLQGKKPQGKLA